MSVRGVSGNTIAPQANEIDFSEVGSPSNSALLNDLSPADNHLSKALQNTNDFAAPFNLANDFQVDFAKTRLNNLFDASSDSDDVANYFSSKEFTQLDPSIQESVKKNFETVKNNPQSIKNFIELAKSGGFRNANKDLQSAMLNSLAKRPEDKIYRAALQEAVGRDDFKKLAQDKQAKVIEDLDKFADKPSYKGDAVTSLSDDDKKFVLEKIRKTSIYSGQNPTNDIVRNTLDNVVNGNIALKLYEKDSTVNVNGTGSTEFGYNKSGTKDIYINKKANDTDYKEFIDTLAHETNHALNGNEKLKYVTDAFLSEYRAHIIGQKAAGKTVDKAALKAIVNNLALAEPVIDSKTKKPKDLYSEIRQTYKTDKNFKALVDQLVKDIDKGTLVDGSDLRTRLMTAGYNSDYIKNTTNINNK